MQCRICFLCVWACFADGIYAADLGTLTSFLDGDACTEPPSASLLQTEMHMEKNKTEMHIRKEISLHATRTTHFITERSSRLSQCVEEYADGLDLVQDGLGASIRAHPLTPVATSERPVVFGAGPGTTGSTSMAQALQLIFEHFGSDHKVAHYGGLPTANVSGCDFIHNLYDAINSGDHESCLESIHIFNWTSLPTDLGAIAGDGPYIFFIDFFLSFPNSRWVLLNRPSLEWAAARADFVQRNHGHDTFTNAVQEPCGDKLDAGDLDVAAQSFELTNKFMRCVVPPDQYLEINLFVGESDHAMQRLRQFMGYPEDATVDNADFPHVAAESLPVDACKVVVQGPMFSMLHAESTTSQCINTYAHGLDQIRQGLGDSIRAHPGVVATSPAPVIFGTGSGTTGTDSLATALQTIMTFYGERGQVMHKCDGVADNCAWARGVTNLSTSIRGWIELSSVQDCIQGMRGFDFSSISPAVNAYVGGGSFELFIDMFLSFPNARFILTSRPPDEWAFSRMQKEAHPQWPMQEPCQGFYDLEMETMSQMYSLTNDFIRCTVPADRFLEIDMFSHPTTHTMKRIREFLGFKENPDIDNLEFPHVAAGQFVSLSGEKCEVCGCENCMPQL